jgi:RHS repeat-associated protein
LGTTATLTWDAADRNTTITETGTTTTYTRDPVDRVVGRQTTGPNPETIHYGHTGYGDTPDYTLNASLALTAAIVALPGGTQLTLQPANTQTWAYPNLHGDLTATANNNGTKTGSTSTYNAWGTGAGPQTIPGADQPGYLGTSGLLTGFGTTLLPVTQMGARPYAPTLGRFLSVDPIQGGCANTYVYVFGDPVNSSDPNGSDVCWTLNAKDALSLGEGLTSGASIGDFLSNVFDNPLASFASALFQGEADTLGSLLVAAAKFALDAAGINGRVALNAYVTIVIDTAHIPWTNIDTLIPTGKVDVLPSVAKREPGGKGQGIKKGVYYCEF